MRRGLYLMGLGVLKEVENEEKNIFSTIRVCFCSSFLFSLLHSQILDTGTDDKSKTQAVKKAFLS